ncbi:hypothetical protein ACFYU9_16265 [Streptomyces sp. NPDC004327]|uniref:hypothetical protein n=1 Tax=unclassified Streptomyces TaxID=2593676 RepID=UPI0036C8456F
MLRDRVVKAAAVTALAAATVLGPALTASATTPPTGSSASGTVQRPALTPAIPTGVREDMGWQ